MSFSFNTALTSDMDIVRLEIGDTDENGYFLHNETILARLASEGSVDGAIVKCIYDILAVLSQPNFRADWLQVDNASARKGYESLLTAKKREYRITTGAVRVSTTHLYRADSLQTETPDYSAGTDTETDS